MKTFKYLARACGARLRCQASNNQAWFDKWTQQIESALESFPHGSGFDNGTHIDLDRSNDDCLRFITSFHHMNEGGMYDGWTEHTVTVTPSLGLDFHVKVSGPNRNDIKDYIAECFQSCLNEEINETADSISQSV